MEKPTKRFDTKTVCVSDLTVEGGSESGVGDFLSATFKRTVDIIVSLLGLVLCSPAFLLFWRLIVREDGGPAIFRQERIGKGGRPFTLYKFRSMVIEAEENGKPALSAKEDDRLTRIGAFLRSHHLDEMPQLWNILRGDMSLVGYRPERKYFIDQIMERNPDYALLYKMRPGIFSMATLYNGYTDTMEKMLKRLDMDLEYLRHNNVFIDVKIIWLTLWSILSGKKF